MISMAPMLLGGEVVQPQVEFMVRTELDGLIEKALERPEPRERISNLIELTKFSYPMSALDFSGSDENIGFESYIPAGGALLADKMDQELVVEAILAKLPEVTDQYYRRRLVYVIEKSRNKTVDQIARDTASPEQLKIYISASSLKKYGYAAPLDFFVPRVPSKEEKLLDEAFKRIKERDEKNRKKQ